MAHLTRRSALLTPTALLLATVAGRAQAAESAPAKPYDFLPLGDFTINLPRSGRQAQYLLISVTLETKSEQTQAFRDLTPRLKETVLQRLLQMSDRRQLQPGVTDPATLRENLFSSLTQVREAGLKSVVITRMLHS